MSRFTLPRIALFATLALTACDKGSAPPPAPPDSAGTADPSGGDNGEASGDPVDAASGDGSDGAITSADDVGGITSPKVKPAVVEVVDEYGAIMIRADPAEGLEKATAMAKIKLEIRSPNGKIHKDQARIVRWDELTRVEMEFQGIEHAFLLDLGKDGKSVSVKLTYLADGEEVIRNYGYDSKVGKREVVRIDDGTALAVTINTKTVKPKPPEPGQEKIKTAEGDDPLAGAKKK